MHVRNLDRALNAMADMITDGGALLLEIADVDSLTFSPADTDSDLWRPWWYALGRTRGLSFDVTDRIIDALHRAGFVIERRDRHQPIASTTQAKLVHALGFDQCIDAYLHEVGAPPEQIDAHRRYIDRVLHDHDVSIALFENTQYMARRDHATLFSQRLVVTDTVARGVTASVSCCGLCCSLLAIGAWAHERAGPGVDALGGGLRRVASVDQIAGATR